MHTGKQAGFLKMDDSAAARVETRSARKRKADDDPNNVIPSTISKHKKRQKRRSSFMRGRSRKSLPPVNIEISELHKRIPWDIPEEKRLELLKQAAFEYTIQKLQTEVPLFDSDLDLQCKLNKAFVDTLADVKGSGILTHACKKNSFEPNPMNLGMNEVVIKMQSHIRRLAEEGEKWDKLLEDQSQAAVEAEKQSAAGQETKPVTKAPDSLNMKQRRVLSDLPDLAAIAEWAHTSAEEVHLQIGQIHQTTRQMSTFTNTMNGYLQHELKQFALESFQGYQDITDPRTLLLKAGSKMEERSGNAPSTMEVGQ